MFHTSSGIPAAPPASPGRTDGTESAMPNPLTRDDLQAELAPLRAQLDGLPLMRRAITVLQQEVRAMRSDLAHMKANVGMLSARIEVLEKGGGRR